MAEEVFISYSSADREAALALKAAIEAEGRTVWLDQRSLAGGDPFYERIAEAIAAAKAVVVLWSRTAVESLWVYSEAERGKRQRKLVTVAIAAPDGQPVEPPMPYDALHTLAYERTADILRSIEARIAGTPMELEPNRTWDEVDGDVIETKLEPFEPRFANTRPSSLLHARHALVPYDDEQGLLADTIAWATGTPPWADGRHALGRLVHGPGGFGKTRLMIEACQALFAKGWAAGFVPREAFGEPARFDMLTRLVRNRRTVNGLLLVVDYAESIEAGRLAALTKVVAESTRGNATPLRLVLLARAAERWWKGLVDGDANLQELVGRAGAPDAILAPEFSGIGARLAMFDEAELHFREQIEACERQIGRTIRRPVHSDPAVVLELISDRKDDSFDRPLTVQMAALLHVLGEAETAMHRGIAGLLDGILGFERRHWDLMLELRNDSTPQRAVHQAVAQATMTGGTTTDEGTTALVRADPLYADAQDTDPVTVCRHLGRVLPRPGEGVAKLEPDLIGEHHVADVATDALVAACLDWAGGDREKRRQILTVLNRASRQEHGDKAERARARLAHLLATRARTLGGDLVHVAVGTPGALIGLVPELIRQVPAMDEAALAPIHDALPLYWGSLADLSLAVAEQRVVLARQAMASHAATGRLDAGASEVDDFGPRGRLARCLDTLGVRLGQAGRREAALAAAQEAAALYRDLAEARPEAFTPELAASLANLGNRLADLGRREDALRAAEEAVDIRRALAAARPEAFTPDLAASLSNLGVLLAALGRRAAALAASEEAVALYRDLAEARPEAFTPDLAISLNNLSNALSALGRREAALAATEEAVALYRDLAAARPEAFTPDLATSLGALSQVLVTLERHADAAAATGEALAALAPLLERHPRAFADLASALLHVHENASAAAGLAPDAALLARVTTALPARELPPEIAALMPILEALQARYEETGALDAALLAQLPDEIAAQVRAAAAAEQAAAGAPPSPDTES